MILKEEEEEECRVCRTPDGSEAESHEQENSHHTNGSLVTC